MWDVMRRYGVLFVMLFVFVLVAGGMTFVIVRNKEVDGKNIGSLFFNATVLDKYDRNARDGILGKIVTDDRTGYTTLVKLQFAGDAFLENDFETSMRYYTDVLNDKAVDSFFRDYAQYRLAMIFLNDDRNEELQKILNSAAVQHSSFALYLREIRALSLLKKGNEEEASLVLASLLNEGVVLPYDFKKRVMETYSYLQGE